MKDSILNRVILVFCDWTENLIHVVTKAVYLFFSGVADFGL